MVDDQMWSRKLGNCKKKTCFHFLAKFVCYWFFWDGEAELPEKCVFTKPTRLI